MYIVFVENSFTLLGKEYFGSDGKHIIGYHDPNRATQFSTQEEAQEFCKLFDYDNKKIELAEKHIKAFSKCKYVYRKLAMLNPIHDYKYNPEIHDKDEILKWRLNYQRAPEKSTSYETYRSWPSFYQHFEHLWEIQSFHSKDYKQKFYTVSLYTDKTGKYQKFKEEFYKVLDSCTFIDDEGRKLFPIFDHELSTYECRYLAFGGEDGCAITNGRRDIHNGTLEEIFNLMKLHYWYD